MKTFIFYHRVDGFIERKNFQSAWDAAGYFCDEYCSEEFGYCAEEDYNEVDWWI